MAQEKRNIRIWTAVKDATAGVMITDRKALLIADKRNFVSATPNGTVISGQSIVLNTVSENIREGAFFVRPNDIVQMFPSTLVTLIPSHNAFTPVGFAKYIKNDLKFFLAMTGA